MTKLGPCREWQGGRFNGYGRVRIRAGYLRVHRLVWEAAHGDIPDGMSVLHKCDNRACYRLSHLFLGTAADNNRDCADKGRTRNQQKTHCPKGHPYTEENTVVHNGWRRCRLCHNEHERLRRLNRKGVQRVND